MMDFSVKPNCWFMRLNTALTKWFKDSKVSFRTSVKKNKLMKKLLLSFTAFIAIQCYGQNLSYESFISHSADVDGSCKILKVKTDISGNKIILGSYFESVDLDPGAGVLTVSSNSSSVPHYFLQKINASGTLVWTIPSFEYQIVDIAVSSTGEVFAIADISGSAGSTIDVDPTSATLNVNSIGLADVLLLKVSATGTILTASVHGLAAENEFAESIDITSTDDVVFCAEASNTSFRYAMILKFSSTGTPIWQKNLSGPGLCLPRALRVDANDAIYITGSFTGLIDFDPGAGAEEGQNATAGSRDKFVVKLTNSGNYVWKNLVAGSSNNLQVASIAVDDLGNTYTVGYHRSNSVIDYSGNGTSTLQGVSGQSRTFVHKLNPNGTHDWAHFQNIDFINQETFEKFVEINAAGNAVVTSNGYILLPSTAYVCGVTIFELGGTVAFEMFEPTEAENLCMHIDASNNLYLGGQYFETMTFNGGTESATTSDASSYLLTYSQCGVSASTTLSGNTLTATSVGTYQWIDCANNMPISGENSQTFTATTNGSYAVVITSGTCSDTSACTTFSTIGLSENEMATFTIFPNPATEQVTISNLEAGSTVVLVDVTGKIVSQVVSNSTTVTIETANFTSGVYFVRVSSLNGIQKLVIE